MVDEQDKPLTFEQLKAFAAKLHGNGLPAGMCLTCFQRPQREAPIDERGEQSLVGYLMCEECSG